MGFTSGAGVLADIIENIANNLIASFDSIDGLPKWTNADTNWNTTTRTANNAKRALKYTNGTEVVYLTLEAINTDGLVLYDSAYGAHAYRYRSAKGIRIGFSPDWNSVSHVPTSTTYITFVEFEAQGSNPIITQADMATLQITYYLWVESNGFVITGKPDVHTNDNKQGSFVIVVERNPNKEYVDGNTNFYCYNMTSMLNYSTLAAYPANNFVRPYTFQTGNISTIDPSGGGDNYSTLGMDLYGIVFPASPYYAFKSTGNGKVYYVKPIINNSSDERTPILQSELFFLYSEGVGLVDGDVIALEGSSTKFLCRALAGPDSTRTLPIAMKYVA